MATYWVRSTGGSDLNDGLSYANAFATIAEGFDNVSQGDTLNIVNDGEHAFTSFGDALTVQATFSGTDYVTDPGLVVQGVDSSGNPALATLAATDDTNCYFFYNMSSAADYIWIRGLKFDYSFFGTNAATIRDIFLDSSTLPPNFKITSCFFDFGALTTTLTEDTEWNVFKGVNGSGSQAASPGTWVVEYCYFRNAHIDMPNVGYINNHVHHCIFNMQAINYSAAVNAINGGSFYPDTRQQRYYNNTIIKLESGANQAGGTINIQNSDTSEQFVYNNIYYVDNGETSLSTAINSAIRNGFTAADKEAAGKMDFDLYAFGTNLGTSPDLSSGYGTRQFCELWRAGSTTFTCTAVPTNSTQVVNVAPADLFNGTGVWTWSDTNAYVDLPVDWDYRLLLERSAGEGGIVPGAVSAVVNQPPVVVTPKTYSATSGVPKSVPAASGLLFDATDPESDTLTATVVSDVSHGSLTINTTDGSFEYTPNLTFTGEDSFTFWALDASTNSNTGTVTISVSQIAKSFSDEFVDTAPFFRPTLEVRTEFRMTSTKNRVKHHDLANYTEDREWNESTHRVINLSTSTTTQVNLGGVAESQYMIVETDNDIDVSINDTARYWSVSKCAAVALGSIETIYLRNNSAANVAQVKLCVSD